jgi:hypothetical protein
MSGLNPVTGSVLRWQASMKAVRTRSRTVAQTRKLLFVILIEIDEKIAPFGIFSLWFVRGILTPAVEKSLVRSVPFSANYRFMIQPQTAFGILIPLKMSKFIRQRGSAIIVVALVSLMFCSACTDNDNSHTTATTVVPAPGRQALTVVEVPTAEAPIKAATQSNDVAIKDRPGVDRTKPLLILNLPNGKTFRVGELVILDFTLLNANLKSDGGEYRIRYFVDDDDPKWIDNSKPIGLAGWLPGKHTIRLELMGPDGWPYRNGDQNIIVREIIVT